MAREITRSPDRVMARSTRHLSIIRFVWAPRSHRSAALAFVMVLSSAAAVIGQPQPAPPAPPPAAALSITWSVTVESPLVAPPPALGRRVFVPLRLGVILAIDRETGGELWRAPVLAQHAASADQGRVLVGTTDALIALNATTGATSWRIPL